MKITKYIIGLGIMAGTVISLPSCTDLSETVYDQVMSQNYYNCLLYTSGEEKASMYNCCSKGAE